ncbi:putative transcriptional regulator, TetR family protein [Mycobacterium antarcticum]|uniref:TetR/AcrR family transcriptional regulator n=1 Tax=Mycolicibacterium sp. TUM20985 TaxID=3023370 RepID=UPI002573D81A|nr:TetR/AcrR family transcriptional regulator [Mycolicibacterium sp. TUM20985]BDX33181.1 putative transcriptional regulator, TetR family protein [Mycolicibacterium sp. TUM20985]
MGRPPVHSDLDFLHAAAALFAGGGDRALTMSSVAREAGASNGSIYHRFPDRASLLAALWLRTTREFEHEYFAVLGDPPTRTGIVGAAAWVVDWCRGHVPEAIVLQAGIRAFNPTEWPESARADAAATDLATQSRIAAAVRAVAKQTGLPRDQIAFAMLDLPLAAVRPHLLAGEAPPNRVTALVRSLAERVLAAA